MTRARLLAAYQNMGKAARMNDEQQAGLLLTFRSLDGAIRELVDRVNEDRRILRLLRLVKREDAGKRGRKVAE